MRIVRSIKDVILALCVLYAFALAAMGFLVMSKGIISLVNDRLSK